MTQQVQVLRGAIRAPQVNFLFEHKNKMTEVICNSHKKSLIIEYKGKQENARKYRSFLP